jgi:hypothetical protein
VLTFVVSDLQLSFPRTACIVNVTDPTGQSESLGKFLVGRRGGEGQTDHHAEQRMIAILRARYFTENRPKGKYRFVMSITRSPCGPCHEALENFKSELREKGYTVSFDVRMASAYGGESAETIAVLRSLREKGSDLEVLTLEKIVAEKLLNDPEQKLSDEDKELLAAKAAEAERALAKAAVKKGG